MSDALRRAITEACRVKEEEAVAALLPAARLPPGAPELAATLIQNLRAQPAGALGEALRAYPLATPEGQALMSLAEALLRIPDAASREELLRDRLRGRHWHANPELRLAARLAASPGWPFAAPVIRRGAEAAIRRMADEFILGQTMQEALARAAAQNFRYSYDMLGEAALTAEDAANYHAAYATAIQSARNGGDVYENDGVSIKLSALHPRYSRAQHGRVMAEMLPRLIALACLAKSRNIGLTLDAEEAARLDLSLDILQALAADKTLQGWHGLGFAIQAYQKRAFAVTEFCIDLARRTGHRLMLRLVKGAYWDSEIKEAQTGGFADYPVFTRKAHTDVSYLACARKMLAAGSAIFPQFATHNALTIAAVHGMAGSATYEFQALHGMGEALYGEVQARLQRPCRIYAPVGPHPALLAYLSRRLLENGANASFINQLHDPATPLADLLRDPAEAPLTPHPAIPLPSQIFAPRENSPGLDLADESVLAQLAQDFAAETPWPDITPTTPAQIETAFTAAHAYAPPPPATRAKLLILAAETLERHAPALRNLLIREARKTIPAAHAEIRETIDFCRYYAERVKNWAPETHIPLGPVICISPWNFPAAIFTGQIAGAFAAGNAVLAKPAEETPRIAIFITNLLHNAGIPRAALHLLPGDGATGAALVADPRAHGVAFTGSFLSARAIQQILARRTNPDGRPVPLIAETGGVNAMIADSTALPEQLIADVLTSAFDSAGQRCSALRLLCLPRAAAPLILPRLRAALAELRTGPPEELATDLGPVISGEAATKILSYIATHREAGHRITQGPAPTDQNFIPPTLIEMPPGALPKQEIFGPVLHVLTYRRTELPRLMRRLNALGYGLTFGIHSRIENRAAALAAASTAGNVYINRNIIGAVVGAQPFGGQGLSGTGPKAGGPLYPHRLLQSGPACWPPQGALPGPTGERNVYALRPGAKIFCSATTAAGRAAQSEAVRAAGATATTWLQPGLTAALLEGEAAQVRQLAAQLASLPGPIIPLYALAPAALAAGATYNPAFLAPERVISTNTAAAGGNAALASII